MRPSQTNTAGPEWDRYLTELGRLATAIGRVPKASTKAILAGLKGRRKRRYHQGFSTLIAKGIGRRDAYIKSMQKLELYEVEKLDSKENRAIQYRSVIYNAAMARELHCFSKRLAVVHSLNDTNTPITTKGMTPRQMAEKIVFEWSTYEDPVALLLDFSRMDGSYTIDTIRAEHAVYKYCRPSKRLSWLLKQQERSYGVTEGGVKYVTYGKRSSGDYNTSDGNTITNYAATSSWCGSVRRSFTGIGDDNVVIMERNSYYSLPPVEGFFLELGFVVEPVIAERVCDIEYCQSKIMFDDQGPIFVRDWKKVVETVKLSPVHYDARLCKQVALANLLCQLAIYNDIPIIGPYCYRNLKHYDGVTPRLPEYLDFKMNYIKRVDISKLEVHEPKIRDTVRMSFHRTFGVDPTMQMWLEESLDYCPVENNAKQPKIKVTKSLEEIVDFEENFTVEPCDCGECPDYSWNEELLGHLREC
ncbi:hypothetical protein [Beihai horseshoe crab virus 1]|uniref:hypothetical protein n=1 Tax=Beihai horseshoe crab virus 1 TaxID=1922392 RepID=UPI00090AA5AA|nr:hypothetical protein [Beihai horseshoe crab virus 1]APG76291.1 hypothetical protein [Beihai horseshoe crab virus 1]